MKKFDVIIIGGGHNGLVASSYLSKKGKKVLLIEKNENVGGLAEYAESLNCISPIIKKELGINVDNINHSNNIISLEDNQNHTILSDKNGKLSFVQTNADENDQKKFLSIINNYKLFSKTLGAFMFQKPPRVKSGKRTDLFQLISMGWKIRKLGKKNMRELLRVIGLNIADDLEDNLNSNSLMGLLSHEAVLGTNLGPRSPGSILTLLYKQAINDNIFNLNKIEVAEYINQLEDCCNKNTVEIIKSSEVKKILTQNNSVTGVQLTNGEVFESKYVISNADPKTTYLNLLGAEILDTDFIRRTKNFRNKGNVAKLELTLENEININNIDKNMYGKFIYAPSIKYIEHAFNANKYNKYSENPCIEFYVNQNTISANVYYVPYLINTNHKESEIIERCVSVLSKFIPDIKIAKQKLITPNKMAEKYNITGGHWHHGDLEIDQLLMMRPFYGSAQYSTPINGLYLCSAGTHPGGGLTGINGLNAAKKVIENLK
jgi:phytoene dehydrogenase-like protein